MYLLLQPQSRKPKLLQYLFMTVNTCSSGFPETLCALSAKGISTCYGDSGSPYAYENKLVGVHLNSKFCVSPSRFLNVAHFYEWISHATKNVN